jgi:Leucine-rich repeat (LRR) protein
MADEPSQYIKDLIQERIATAYDYKFLDLNGLGLTKLPPIDYGIHILYCRNNRLKSLEGIPQSLKIIDCDNNPALKFTDKVLPRHLEHLSCSGCNLTELPPLPKELKSLICRKNRLVTLPSLPVELEEFDCSRNRLTHLPRIPETVRHLCVSNNNWSPRFLLHIKDLIMFNNDSVDMLESCHADVKKAVRNYLLVCHKLDKSFNKMLLFEETLREKSVLNQDVINNICSFISGHNGPFEKQAALVSQSIASGELTGLSQPSGKMTEHPLTKREFISAGMVYIMI